MKSWWRRIRAGLGMGLVWALGGFGVGGLIELVSNLFPSLPLYAVDMWPQTLAIPGFVGGVIFSGVLRVAARDRSLDELSFPAMAGWGGLTGVLLGGFFMALGAGPLIFVPALGLSVVGASLTLVFVRMADRQGSLEAGRDPEELPPGGA